MTYKSSLTFVKINIFIQELLPLNDVIRQIFSFRIFLQNDSRYQLQIL